MALDSFDSDMSEISEEFTLESILAEYKGISYIDGDKKTPKGVLDEKARRIVQEETGAPTPEPVNDGFDVSALDFLSMADDSPVTASEATPPVVSASAPEITPEASAKSSGVDEFDTISWALDDKIVEKPVRAAEADIPAAKFEVTIPPPTKPLTFEDGDFSDSAIESFVATDSEMNSFGDLTYSTASLEEEVIRSVSEVMERESIGDDDYEAMPHRRGFRLREDKPFDRHTGRGEPDFDEPEPDLRERARAYAIRCNELSMRAVLALVLSIFLAALTFIFESGRSLPFGIGQNTAVAGGVFLIIQILVMLLGVSVLIRGVIDLFEGEASAETLVFFASAVSLLAGIYGMRNGGALLPYSAITSLSLAFAMWGERMYLQGMADTLRCAATVANPHSMVSEYRLGMDKTVIRKTMGRHHGFYGNLQQADTTELAYRYAAPLMILFCIIITVFSAVMRKDFSSLPAMLASTCAAAATFTSTLVFSSPFRSLSKQGRAGGSAIAGAGGIDDIFYMDGLCVTDEDLYPADTLDVGSVRILDQVSPEKAIRYTASMIVASGSCLARVFTSILETKGMSLITTQDFTAGEGGVSGIIRREQVHTGNFAYMNLYGVRVPDELKMGNAIYTAVDGRMIAMFSVDYRPSNTIRNAIMAVLRHGVKLYLTVRDFNITPMTVEQKFKIPMEDFEVLPIGSTYSLSNEESGRGGRSVAVCPNGGLVEMSRIISSARRAKLVSLIGTIISVASAIAGVVLMAVLGWAGNAGSAKPGSLMLFMLAPLVIMILTELITSLQKNKD